MSVVVRAPAKLTVSLRITGVRADGYHLVDAEMVALELADLLTISEGSGLEVIGPYAAGVPVDGSNLVSKALQLAGRDAHVVIDKRIPPLGGLGGGSSDAAAVLRWAGVTDVTRAAALGADVAFSLVGGRARVRGIGEQIEPLPPVSRTYTLCLPPFGVSTVAAYRAWDELGGPTGEAGNDLEPAACHVEPRLRTWIERFSDAAGVRARLAGSGSTLFVEGAHPDIGAELTPATVVVTRTDRPQPGAVGDGD